ncbi:MAG: PsiF family protein [Afipia sp.]|jgi:hypothetical protein
MKSLSSFCAALAVASFMLTGMASAQTQTAPAPAAKPAPAAAAPKAAKSAATPKATKPRTAASLECSKQADAKGLHGKERKKFRSECKRNAGKAN